MENILRMSNYIIDELGNLHSVLTDAIKSEKAKKIDGETDPDAERDRDWIVAEMIVFKDKMQNTAQATFRILAQV